jgi:WD40 repeat protein
MAPSIKASVKGLEIVDKARRMKGWNKTTTSAWHELAECSKSVFDNFWKPAPINQDNFVKICRAVGVDWNRVVDSTYLEDDQLCNPNPINRPEVDRFKGLKIAKHIHDWLKAVEYQFKESYEVLEVDYCEWIIKIQDSVRRARVNHILIRGIASEAKVADLQALKASLKEQGANGGWLIVNRRISPAVKAELEKEENQHLSCMTFDELIDQDADFEPYLQWLEEEVIKRGIDRKYVSLACDKEEIDPVTQHSIATSSYGEAEGWIEGYIKQWLSDDSKEHVSILGEFGTGKTWFSFHYAWDCLRAYKNAKEQGLERPRLPLVIALRDYNKALKVESVLSDLFFNKHDIRLNSSVFDCLNQMGKLVIIFDGFDEMADKVDRQKMINNFWELARVVCPGSKVILTSRTEHFPHDRESRQLLNAELESSTAKLKWESPRFELLELAKFNETQIRRVLTLEAEEKGLSTDIVEKVMVRAELLDLARRPVMTELIIEAMPEIEAGKPVDMSRIYYYAIIRKMDRDIKAERTFTSLADKLYFLCEIAWEMLSTERMKLNYREFPDRIRQIFPQLVTEAKDLDHWHYDMMGQTILIRNADGDYTPAHRSLLEFLVAYKFAAEAGVLKADFVAAVQDQSDCIDRDAMPQDYTWTGYLQACVAAKCEGRKIAPLRGFIPESSEYLRDTFGYEPLTKAVIDLIVLMLELPSQSDSFDKSANPLLELIRATKGKTELESGWLGGNAATLLVKQNFTALDCEDLSYTQMANSDLMGANLQHVNFTETNLTNSIFTSVLPSEILKIAISQDGEFFVTVHKDRRVRRWDVTTGQLIFTYTDHLVDPIVIISSNGIWLLVGGGYGSSIKNLEVSDGIIKRWNVETGKCLQIYTAHQSKVISVAISPDDSWFISNGLESNIPFIRSIGDSTLKCWDAVTGECLHTYIGHEAFVNAVAISRDASWFISASCDNTLKRWDKVTGKCLNTYIGHESAVNAVAISPDDLWLVSCSSDNMLKRWDVVTGECLHSFYITHEGLISVVAISPNGLWFMSHSDNNTLKCWDAVTGECLNTYIGHESAVNAVAISSDSSWFLSASSDNMLKRWDINTSKCLYTCTGYNLEVKFTPVVISLDSTLLVSGSNNYALKSWSIDTGKCLYTYAGHKDWVTAIGISFDGSWLVSSSNDKTLKRWDTLTGECLHTYTGHDHWVRAIAISPDGSWFISGSNDKLIKRWDTLTGECLHTYIGHDYSIVSVAISTDSLWFVSGSNDYTLKRWDISGECLHTYIGHEALVNAIAISPDGSWLISGSDDCTLKRWDTLAGECLHTYEHKTFVNTATISPDGSWFVSGSRDYILKRWDTLTGECLHVYTGHQEEISAVAVVPDGRYIISGGGDEIKIWDVETGECIRTISNKPCGGMRIGGAIGLTSGQIESLKALGAVDD